MAAESGHARAGGARPMWRCPNCGREFANRNQYHSCQRATLGDHLDDKPEEVRELYRRFEALVRERGPVEVEPLKTRIGFKRRNAFAAVTPRKRWLDGHLVIAEPFAHPLFERIEAYSPRLHVHHFRARSPGDFDDAFRAAVGEACSLGDQEHLQERP